VRIVQTPATTNRDLGTAAAASSGVRAITRPSRTTWASPAASPTFTGARNAFVFTSSRAPVGSPGPRTVLSGY